MSSLAVNVITPQDRISSELCSFTNNANKVIMKLQGPCQSVVHQRSSFQNRLEVADEIDQLRKQAKEIQTLIEQNPYVLEGCPVKQLSDDFEGKSIRYASMLTVASWAESAGPGNSWDIKAWGISEPLRNSIDETVKKIKVAERESILIFSHFNKPDDSSNQNCVIS